MNAPTTRKAKGVKAAATDTRASAIAAIEGTSTAADTLAALHVLIDAALPSGVVATAITSGLHRVLAQHDEEIDAERGRTDAGIPASTPAHLADARRLHHTLVDLHCRMEWHATLAATIEHFAQGRNDMPPAVAAGRIRQLAGLAQYLGDDAADIAD